MRAAIAAFEEIARSALAAAGSTRADEGARALVALADGFALHRLAWPRGEADRVAYVAAMRTMFMSYVLDREEREAWDKRLAQGPRTP